MTKPRTGTMIERSPQHWRLQVTAEPDLVTGDRRRLSRTVTGTRTDARHALQRLVVEAGAGLHGEGGTTVGVLLEQFMGTAALADARRLGKCRGAPLAAGLRGDAGVEAHGPRL